MDRRTVEKMTNGIKRRSISFRFFPQGTSTTPLTSAAGTLRDPGRHVANVTRTGTAGVFTVTMNERARRVIAIHPSVQLSANNVDLSAQAGDVSNEGTNNALTFNVRLMTGTTATDMAANANNSVSVTVEIEDSAAAGVA
jgi:hypothetical protein